jgi:DNA polymerase III epsilon subunit-like protein
MIVVDIETSGIDFLKNGIWQIGAIDSDDSKRIFLDECRIDNEDTITKEALNVVGVTEEYIRSIRKQSQKELLEKFFEWCKDAKVRNFICHNPQFDFSFIKCKADKYGLKMPVHFRCFDTHSIASLKYYEIYDKLPIENDYSIMGLPNVLFFCGMQDNRDKHNALEDAKLTAECFYRIVYGKNFLKEFEQYPIPKHLEQK